MAVAGRITMTASSAIETWHRLVRTSDVDGLRNLLADDVVFHSPVVHTPQRGKDLACGYLSAAFMVLGSHAFRYVREVSEGNHAVLEFEADIEGIIVNGVDMITWNEDDKIVDFKVMLRPLKAVNLIHQKMARMLESMR
jgi:ketosteroid isomerase-like protein